MTGWDVIVVGAGPAGSMISRELAKRGRSVLLVERSELPRWKVCGACLGPAALNVLSRTGLGALPEMNAAVPLTHMSLTASGRRVRIHLAGSVVLSRMALDRALAEAAVAAGATLRMGCRVVAQAVEGDRVSVTYRVKGEERVAWAKVVVDAGGLGGALPDPAGARIHHRARVGLGAVFPHGSWVVPRGELHMVVGRAGYVGLVEQEDGSVNVAAAVDPSPLRASGPDAVVIDLLASAGVAAPTCEPAFGWRGTPSLTRSAGRAGEARLFRLGDAAGYVEPFTGEGMGWALGEAVALSYLVDRSVEEWRPSLLDQWALHRARFETRSTLICRVLATGLRRPRFVRAGMRLAARVPSLAGALVRATARPPRSPSWARAST